MVARKGGNMSSIESFGAYDDCSFLEYQAP
jgi:hypothetical protein